MMLFTRLASENYVLFNNLLNVRISHVLKDISDALHLKINQTNRSTTEREKLINKSVPG
jgi:hypothetical protein